MTAAMWLASGWAASVLAAFIWGYAIGKRRVAVRLSRDLAEAEARLEAAKRGDDAQNAQHEAFHRARGGLGRRVRRRLRELGRIK